MTDYEGNHPWEAVYTEYKNKFEKENPEAFAILEIGGVHPDKLTPMSNPYLDNVRDNEDFRNVGRHCIEVGIVASKISDSLLKTGAINGSAATNIVNRALIHDANKRFEVFRRKAKDAGKSVDVYSTSAYETMSQQVRAQGKAGPLVDYISKAGKETGHNSMADFITLDGQGEPMLKPDLTVEELVVHLADDMVASPLPGKTKNTETKLVTIKERMDLGNFPIRYAFLYKEGFGFAEDGKTKLVKDVGDPDQITNLKQVKTYAVWQEITARLVCEKLKSMLGEQKDKDAEQLVKEIANN